MGEVIKDSQGRSIAKTVTWKTLTLILGFIVTYWISGDFELSSKVSIIAFFVGLVAFYLHERIWNNIQWGRVTK